MKPESWKQLDQLFHEALALPPDECDAFLKDACAGDDSLRRIRQPAGPVGLPAWIIMLAGTVVLFRGHENQTHFA